MQNTKLTLLIVVVIVLIVAVLVWLALRRRPSPPLCTRGNRIKPNNLWRPELDLPTAAYNPSTAKLTDGRVIYTYRVSSFTRCPGSRSEELYHRVPGFLGSKLMLAWANRNGESKETLLDIPEPTRITNGPASFVPGYEDARIVEWKGHLLLLANARCEDVKGHAQMHLIYVCPTDEIDRLRQSHTCRVARLKSAFISTDGDEKNWVPLVWKDPLDADRERLFLLYSLAPHRVLEIEENTVSLDGVGELARNGSGVVECKVVHEEALSDTERRCRSRGIPTKPKLPNGDGKDLLQLRGGTQAIYTTNARGVPSYLGLGHYRSYKQYYSIAYELDSVPPFALRSIGRPFKLEGATVEYVAGLRSDGQGSFAVTYGVNDCESAEAILTREQLFGW